MDHIIEAIRKVHAHSAALADAYFLDFEMVGDVDKLGNIKTFDRAALQPPTEAAAHAGQADGNGAFFPVEQFGQSG